MLTDDTASTWRQLQGLMTDAARVQARWAKAVAAAAKAAGRGESVGTGPLLQAISREYQTYLRELGRLNVQYARALQDLAATTSERLTDAVQDGARHSRGSGRPHHHSGSTAATAALVLDGTLGHTASGSFTVANTRDRPAELSFAAGRLADVADPDDRAPAAFTFDPGSVRLEPGAEATVTVLLPLDRDRFRPGHEYRGEIRVEGGDGTRLDVTVRAVPDAAAAGRTTARRTAKKAATTKAGATRATTKKAGPRPARARRTPPRQG